MMNSPGFWLVVVLMLLAALAFVAWPLLRGARNRRGLTHEEVDVSVYRRRLREIEQEREQGLLTDEAAGQARIEAQQQLLDQAGTSAPESVAGQGINSRRTLLVAVILLPVLALGLYWQLGGTPERSGESQSESGQPPSVQAMVEGLEQRLRREPDDGEGWLMLGRSYAVLDRPGEAVTALRKARELLGDSPEVMLEYAQALAGAREQPSFSGRPADLVGQALAQAPDNPRALWLAGVVATERGEYEQAVSYWRRLQAQRPSDSEDARIIEQNIAALTSQIQGVSGSVENPGPEEVKPVQEGALAVTVSLDPSLSARADPEAAVFVFAREINGPPMPLAVVKRKVRDLPLTVTLSDANSMMAGRGISSQGQVEVLARVSRSGGVSLRPGDLKADPKQVTVGGRAELRIDEMHQ